MSESYATPRAPTLRRLLLSIGGVYTAQSLVGGISFLAVPTVLRASGAPLEVAGLASLLMLPWALKFIWSPWVELWRQAGGVRRRSRAVVLIGELVAAGGLGLLALAGPDQYGLLFGLLMLVALASASVDIAVDAFAIEQLAPSDRGWGNTAQVGGGYLGIAIGGGVFLILITQLGWTVALAAAAIAILALSTPFVLGHEPQPRVTETDLHRPSLAFAWRRREVRIGLLVVILFEAGVRSAQAMTGPFLIDSGLGLELVGTVSGLGGVAAGLAGTLIGGWLVQRIGARRAVIPAAALQAAFLATMAASSLIEMAWLSAIATLLLATGMAIGFVALYALLMGLSSLRQAGVDFTLFQCADALIAGVAGYGAALLAGSFGYGACFAGASAIAATGLFLIVRLLRSLPPTEPT